MVYAESGKPARNYLRGRDRAVKQVSAVSRIARLADLPNPPDGCEGWPWTEETPPLPETSSAGRNWPRFSVVTPSYNQGKFLEQTIRSVLLQGYPDLEYIVIDGGSTDESVAVIKKYEKHLAYWVSERDRGQSHAINKGFERATGAILCWLNSDDYYLPGTLRVVAENLTGDTLAVVGHCVEVDADGRPSYHGIGRFESLERLLQFWKGYQMHQPSIFWRREVFNEIGYLDESQHLIMDFDYWARVAGRFQFKNIDRDLSCVTRHADAKTADNFKQYYEHLRIHSRRYWPSPFTLAHWRLRASMFTHLYLKPPFGRVIYALKHRSRRARKFLASRKAHPPL
jgi:glycosyltransferase involved in cell wall biosynthesis